MTPRLLEAIERHSDLVPCLHTAAGALRDRGIKIAATTGYFRAAADAVLAAAKRRGYVPDFAICADDVPAGRPAPWMIFRCMEALAVYPPAAVVKVGDTPVDIEEGRNAGCWSAGVIDTSNEMGLPAAELFALPGPEREARREQVRQRYRAVDAHVLLGQLGDLPAVIDELNRRLARGIRP